MIKGIKKSIVKTLCYSDIFEYPLTKEELWKFLILDKKALLLPSEFEKALEESRRFISVYNNYYYLKGKKYLTALRKKREKESKKKLAKAGRTIKILSFIPSILFIGVSGSLSMDNAEKKDDIDLFIVCKKDTVWTTRICVLVILEILGVRRKRNDKVPKDKICLNMLITNDSMTIHRKKQNLYTAHEVVQLRAVFEREGIYQKFLNANKWVLKYLPHSFEIKKSARSVVLRTVTRSSVLEVLAKKLQLWYMIKHKTTETVSDSLLAFHPQDNADWILREYNKRIKRYEKV